jgi:hypothetical protein
MYSGSLAKSTGRPDRLNKKVDKKSFSSFFTHFTVKWIGKLSVAKFALLGMFIVDFIVEP